MAMKPLKTAHDMFYFVEDVMQILGYSKSKSYKVIKSLNRELENQGKCTCDGRVIKRYFMNRILKSFMTSLISMRRIGQPGKASDGKTPLPKWS